MNPTFNPIPFSMSKKYMLSLLIALSLLTVIAFSGCSSTEAVTKDTSSDPPVSGTAKYFANNTVEAKSIVVDLDVSRSTNKSFPFANDVRTELTNRVASYIPPKPTNKESGTATIPGLRIAVYLINSQNAAAYNEAANHNNIICEIPGIPSLDPRPEIPKDGVTEEYAAEYASWKKASEAWSEAYDISLESAQSAAEAISGIDLSITAKGKASGIYNAVCASLRAMPEDNVSVLVASDLYETADTEKGTPPKGKTGTVVFILPCPDGDQQHSDELAGALSQTMVGWGFEEALIFPPDLTKQAIDKVFDN